MARVSKIISFTRVIFSRSIFGILYLLRKFRFAGEKNALKFDFRAAVSVGGAMAKFTA